MSARKASSDADQVMFTFVGAQMQSLGDGTYKYIPGKPVEEVTTKQAAIRLGIHERTVRRLFEAAVLPGRRPTRRKILLLAAGVEKHYADTFDPEFWAKKKP